MDRETDGQREWCHTSLSFRIKKSRLKLRNSFFFALKWVFFSLKGLYNNTFSFSSICSLHFSGTIIHFSKSSGSSFTIACRNFLEVVTFLSLRRFQQAFYYFQHSCILLAAQYTGIAAPLFTNFLSLLRSWVSSTRTLLCWVRMYSRCRSGLNKEIAIDRATYF
jgi:hypothetical protein